MLNSCPKCEQVIEIESINSHLLDECDFRDECRKCPTCEEAIAVEHFEGPPPPARWRQARTRKLVRGVSPCPVHRGNCPLSPQRAAVARPLA